MKLISLRTVRRPTCLLPAVLVALAMASCSDATSPPVATGLEVVAGGGQSAMVNTAVATPPAVRVVDAAGSPMVGTAVTFSVVSGGGSVTGGTATTSQTGVATVGVWTLGTVPGANRLRASAGSLSTEFEATATAGGPATITIVAGNDQSAPVVSAVTVRPAVRVVDEFGNPVAGRRVTFSPLAGSGSVTGATPDTDETGTATVGSWTLGGAAGTQTLRATVTGLPGAEISATGLAGSATKIVVAAGNDQTGAAGKAVSVAPRVRVSDTYGNGLPGHVVTFTVTSGGGSLTGAQGTSAEDGIVQLGGWVLGTTPGQNTVVASAAGLAPATLVATAVPGDPATLTLLEGDAQTADPGAEVAVRPSVRVEDEYGNLVLGASVVFAVASGGGLVHGATQETDPLGIARSGGWTLGPAEGPNTLTATVGTLAPVTFTATGQTGGGGSDAGSYAMTVRYQSALTPSQTQAVNAAFARWESVIAADVPDIAYTDDDACLGSGGPPTPVNEVVDDLIIFVQVTQIDGNLGTLARATPCFVRLPSWIPFVGIIQLDEADLQWMEANDLLYDVVLHEIGHVVGIHPTIWANLDLVGGSGTTDPFFNGVNAVGGFDAVGGQTYLGNKVPLETGGGAGTVGAHWREDVLGNELMTGFISAGGNPLSLVTVGALQDVGYAVDNNAADSFSLGSALRFQGDVLTVELHEKPFLVPRGVPLPGGGG